MKTVVSKFNRTNFLFAWAFAAFPSTFATAYEINNHADMSEAAARVSFPQQSGFPRLAKLGLRPLSIFDPLQTFPLSPGLPQIRKCFGELEGGGQELGTSQPPWGADAGRTQLQIAQLFRYGACFEDNTGSEVRPFAHFYDPQHNGRGLTVSTGALGPSSVEWVLNPSTTGFIAGINHYGWADARDFFYNALTYRSVSNPDNALVRRQYWAKTFQAVGHIVHHLQDMAQPQHVRNDQHCDKLPCTVLGSNKESGYEKFWQGRADTIRALAATATTPVLFGLPREFWNANLDAQLQAPNLSAHMSSQSGLAAYTSSNFVSTGTDFTIERSGDTRTPFPNYDFNLPRPSTLPNDVTLATLFENSSPSIREALRTKICGGDLSTCKMRFYGSEVDPAARTSSLLYFSQEYLGAATTPTRGRAGYFTQNFWTYADAATKLIPKAVEYSAGLINYFFRGEMEISLPEEGVYGIVDHAVTNAKGDGYKLLKMRVKNVTADITTAVTPTRPTGVSKQDMSAGQFFAIAKFHRNT